MLWKLNYTVDVHVVSINWSCHHVCVSLCSPPRLLITSGITWITYDWLNKFNNFCVAAMVDSVIRCGLTIAVFQWNQPNKSKLALYKPLLHFYIHLKQLYMTNKMEHFCYIGGCDLRGHMDIEIFQRRTGLG